MGSVSVDCETQTDLDDSGCVQDDFVNNCYGQVSLLDLSDDVLLYILRHCSPRDLKALGFSCARLGRLVRERSLWRHVDARSESCSQARLKWLLENTLHKDTHLLMVSGYAKATEGCLGLINVTRKEAAEEKRQYNQRNEPRSSNDPNMCDQIHEIPIPVHLERHHARFFISAQRTPHLPRFRGFPSWADDTDMGRSGPDACSGPQFSLSPALLRQLCAGCPQLSTLALEYCNIDCNRTNLGHFPKTLKKLSLRGTKCYNMAIDKSFLFKIQDYLPILESLDVSECEWMDPATLLPLSKLATLEELIMRDCHKLAEFVAYASLTARYGFRTLKSLDLRGSPVGDSEVSALGWLPRLEKLWLAASPRTTRAIKHHAHYTDDHHTPHEELHHWETQEPDYFKPKSNPDPEDTEKEPQPSTSVFGGYQSPRPNNNTNLTDREKEGSVKRKPEDGSGDSADINGESPVVKKQKINNDNNENTNIPKENNQPCQSNEPNLQNNEPNPQNSEPTPQNSEPTPQNSEPTPQMNDMLNDDNIPKNRIMKIDCEINVNVIGVIETDEDEPEIYLNRDDPERAEGNEEGNRDNNPPPDANRESNDPQNANPDCIVDCIKIDQLIDVGELRCGRQNEVIVIASTSRAKINNPPRPDEGYVQFRRTQDPANPEVPENPTKSDEKDDQKNLKRPNEVNEGASTSKEEKSDEPQEKYVCFRKNQEPVYVNCSPESANQNQANQRREPLPPIQYQIEPRHHVLYVSVGPQLNTYRFPRDSSELDRHLNLNFRPTHVDSSSLVTDFAIRRFGRADGEDVNIIHIGPNGPMVVGHDTGSRPDRSNLRFLSVTGYRNITDRSLVHLATAAPNLTRIDFSETNVSDSGAETFRSIRPDCELTYSKYTENKE